MEDKEPASKSTWKLFHKHSWKEICKWTPGAEGISGFLKEGGSQMKAQGWTFLVLAMLLAAGVVAFGAFLLWPKESVANRDSPTVPPISYAAPALASPALVEPPPIQEQNNNTGNMANVIGSPNANIKQSIINNGSQPTIIEQAPVTLNDPYFGIDGRIGYKTIVNITVGNLSSEGIGVSAALIPDNPYIEDLDVKWDHTPLGPVTLTVFAVTAITLNKIDDIRDLKLKITAGKSMQP